jgi:hypothetical protein
MDRSISALILLLLTPRFCERCSCASTCDGGDEDERGGDLEGFAANFLLFIIGLILSSPLAVLFDGGGTAVVE